MLQNPDYEQPKEGMTVKKFWITDYPLLCYLSKGKEDVRTDKKPSKLVMVNLADQEAP